MRTLSATLIAALVLIVGPAKAEPVKHLSHRDRLYDATAYGDATYVVGHPGLLLRSRDGGKTFESVRAGQVDEALFGIAFNGKGQGAVVGRSGFVLTTLDGGKSWQKTVVKFDQDAPSLFSVAVLPSGTIVAAGEFGAIARSEDHGKTWSRSSYTIKVDDTRKGKAPADPACVAMGTSESENDDVVQEARLTDVSFVDDKLGYITAEFGLILRSEDGGRSFQRQSSCTGQMLFSVFADSPAHALAVGANGAIVETQDGGFTWTPRESQTQEHLYGVFARDKLAIVLGAAGVALRREGAGPFQVADTGVHGWLTNAYLDGAGKGVIIGGRGYLRTTQDGGKTQQRVYGE